MGNMCGKEYDILYRLISENPEKKYGGWRWGAVPLGKGKARVKAQKQECPQGWKAEVWVGAGRGRQPGIVMGGQTQGQC